MQKEEHNELSISGIDVEFAGKRGIQRKDKGPKKNRGGGGGKGETRQPRQNQADDMPEWQKILEGIKNELPDESSQQPTREARGSRRRRRAESLLKPETPLTATPAETSESKPEEPPVELFSTPEPSSSPEFENTPELSAREEVILAFESALNIFENFPRENLTPQQQAALDLIHQIKAKTLDRGQQYYMNSFTSEEGKRFTQREHIPVGELILFLLERIKNEELSGDQAEEYSSWADMLLKHSYDYYKGANRKHPERVKARILQEQARVAADPRLRKGSDRENYLEAGRIIFKRRELIIPTERKPRKKIPDDIDPIIVPEPIDLPPIPDDTEENIDEPENEHDATLNHGFGPEDMKTPEDEARDLLERNPKVFVTRQDIQILLNMGVRQYDIDHKMPEEVIKILKDKLKEKEPQETEEKLRREEQNTEPTKDRIIFDERYNPTHSEQPDTDEQKPPKEVIPAPNLAESETPPTPRNPDIDKVPVHPRWRGYQGAWKEQPINVLGEPTLFRDETGDRYYVSVETAYGKGHVPIEEIEARMTEVTPLAEVRREITFGNRMPDIRKRGERAAQKKLDEEARKKVGLNPIAWMRQAKFRIGDEYYRQKYINAYMEKAIVNNNSFLEMNLAKGAAADATANIAYEREAGFAKIESLKTGDRNLEQIETLSGELKTRIIDTIIKPVIRVEMDEFQIQEAMTKLVRDEMQKPESLQDSTIIKFFGPDNKYGMTAEYFATDAFEIAYQMKLDYAAHKQGEETIEAYIERNLDINFARPDWAHATEGKFTAADKIVAALRKKDRGLILNPATIGAVTALGLYVPRSIASRAAVVAGAALPLPFVGGLLTGATFAAFRRNYEYKVDRAVARMDEEYSLEPSEKSPRREEVAPKDMAHITDLLGRSDESENSNPRNVIENDNGIGLRNLLKLPLSGNSREAAENVQMVAKRIAEINTRLELSKKDKLGYIKYSHELFKDQGENALKRNVREAEVVLERAGLTHEEIKALEKKYGQEWQELIKESNKAQDKEFNRKKRNKIAQAFVLGGATGAAGGFLGHEVLERIHDETGANFNPGELLHKGRGLLDKLTGLHRENHGSAIAGNYRINAIDSSPYHSAYITDEHGKLISDTGISVTENGHVIINHADLAQNQTAISDLAGGKNPDFTIGSEHTTANEILHANAGLKTEHFGTHDIQIPKEAEIVKHSDGTFDVVAQKDGRVLASDVRFDANGTAHFDQTNSILHTSDVQTGTQQEVFGQNGILDKNKITIDHRQWYAYNTSLSDRNELAPQNYVSTAANGQRIVTIDINNMKDVSFQNGNDPQSVNLAKAISEGRIHAFISTGDNPQSGIEIPFDSHGQIVLDPTNNTPIPGAPAGMTYGQASQIYIDQNALSGTKDGFLGTEYNGLQKVFNFGHDGKPGTIEIGEVVKNSKGNVLDVFATGHGTGTLPATLGHPITVFNAPDIVDHDKVVELIPNPIPITPPDHIVEPIIPTPFVSRFPLEANRPVTTPPPFTREEFSEQIPPAPDQSTNTEATTEIPNQITIVEDIKPGMRYKNERDGRIYRFEGTDPNGTVKYADDTNSPLVISSSVFQEQLDKGEIKVEPLQTIRAEDVKPGMVFKDMLGRAHTIVGITKYGMIESEDETGFGMYTTPEAFQRTLDDGYYAFESEAPTAQEPTSAGPRQAETTLETFPLRAEDVKPGMKFMDGRGKIHTVENVTDDGKLNVVNENGSGMIHAPNYFQDLLDEGLYTYVPENPAAEEGVTPAGPQIQSETVPTSNEMEQEIGDTFQLIIDRLEANPNTPADQQNSLFTEDENKNLTNILDTWWTDKLEKDGKLEELVNELEKSFPDAFLENGDFKLTGNEVVEDPNVDKPTKFLLDGQRIHVPPHTFKKWQGLLTLIKLYNSQADSSKTAKELAQDYRAAAYAFDLPIQERTTAEPQTQTEPIGTDETFRETQEDLENQRRAVEIQSDLGQMNIDQAQIDERAEMLRVKNDIQFFVDRLNKNPNLPLNEMDFSEEEDEKLQKSLDYIANNPAIKELDRLLKETYPEKYSGDKIIDMDGINIYPNPNTEKPIKENGLILVPNNIYDFWMEAAVFDKLEQKNRKAKDLAILLEKYRASLT